MKSKVPLFQAPQRFVTVDTDATPGAVIGRNLFWPDGAVVVEADFYPPVPDNPNGSVSRTLWSLVLDIPPNIVSLAALSGKGHPYRKIDGSWSLRRSGRQVIDFTFGDASPSPIYTITENAANVLLRIVIRVPFNGVGAALSLNAVSGPTLLPSSAVAPSLVGGYESAPDAVLVAGDVIRLVITPGSGATAGSGSIIVDTIPLLEN